VQISAALNRDPLNHDALPAVGGMGFDYRTTPKLHARTFEYTLYLFIVILLISLALTFIARLLSGFLGTAFGLAALTGLSVSGSLYHYVADDQRASASDPLRRLFLPMALGPVAWLLAYLATWTAAPGVAVELPFAMALALLAFFTDRLATHYIKWLLAGPRLNAASRHRWDLLWSSRFKLHLPDQPENLRPRLVPVWRQARAAVRTYRRCILFLLAAYPVCMLLMWALSARSPVGQMLAGSVCLLLFTLALLTTALRTSRHHLSIIRDAIVNWFTYNVQETRAPGVFVSPGGPFKARIAVSAVALFLLVFTIAPMALYFPFGVAFGDPDLWTQAAYQADSARDWIPGGSDPSLGAPVSRDFLRQHLTPDQRAYYGRLPSDAARNEYLDQLVYRYRVTGTGDLSSYRSRILSHVTRNPESWLAIAWVGAFNGQALFIWSLVGGVLLSMLVPATLFVTYLYAAAGGAMTVFRGISETDMADLHPTRATDWKCYVTRLREAQMPEKHRKAFDPRHHLWLGTSVWNNYPVFLDRSILHNHAHILGDTGSGKTSLGLAPLISQLIASGRPDPEHNHPGHSVVIIDLKGEPPFFQGVRIESRAAGLPFKWFTNENGRTTHVFNPFLQRSIQDLTPNQKTELLLQAMSLDHGEGYGASYFSRVNRQVLSRELNRYAKDKIPLSSFLALHELFEDSVFWKQRDHTRDAATELTSVVENLASFEALNVVPEDVVRGYVKQTALDQMIDMGEVMAHPQVVYFYLPAAIESASVREIGKLAMYTLLSAAIQHERIHGKPGRVYLVIDEFQQIVAKSMAMLLQQARSKGIAMILANQSISDLKTHDTDLAPTVQTNTAFKQFFSAGDLVQQTTLIESSGEALYDLDLSFEPTHPVLDHTLQWPTDLLGDLRPPSDVKLTTRLTRNDILQMSDAPTQPIVHVQHGKGLTQFRGFPLLIESGFHITQKRFIRRACKPWPLASPATVCAPFYPTGYTQQPQENRAPVKATPVIESKNDDDATLPSTAQRIVEFFDPTSRASQPAATLPPKPTPKPAPKNVRPDPFLTSQNDDI
jgi:hypothetical protein